MPVRIFDLNLPASRTGFHLVAKAKSRLLQIVDERRKIRDLEHHAIPASRLLLLSAGHWLRPGRPGAAQQDLRIANRRACKRGELLVSQREPELLRIEPDRARDIPHLVTNTMDALDGRRRSAVGVVWPI